MRLTGESKCMPPGGAKVVISAALWCTARVSGIAEEQISLPCSRRKGAGEEVVLRVCGKSERKERWAAGCPSLPPDPEKKNTVLYTVLKHDI